ncbi:MAG TPA: histidine kinase [Gaiellaceae bacterium]|nr:histidine kinase [Gaiellaceae bacterium]
MSRALGATAAAVLAATGGAVLVTVTSRHAPHPASHAALTALVCLAFAAAGLLALRRPPYVRFGLLLVAVGLSSLLGSLHDANGAVPYTVGVLASNLVFALLAHALLAFPGGRLETRANRLLAAAAYADVLGLQALATVFDPLTRWDSDHPRNAALLHASAGLATALEEVEAGVALALTVAIFAVLYRRARAATAVARRQHLPVALGGKLALLSFSVGLALAPLSSGAAVIGIGFGFLAALALPAAFLGVLLQGRLSRAAVGELLVELRERSELADLRDALRRALGDPSLELRRAGEAFRSAPADHQVALPILHRGEPVGDLVHDRSLRLRPELLDAVSAAAGFALANERALATAQRMEARNRALLGAIPDLMFRVARDGTYLDVRAEDRSGLLRPPEKLLGRNVREVLPPSVADAVLACVERALRTGEMSSVEYELTIGGVARSFESRMVPSGAGEVVTIVRDFTEKRRAEAELHRLLAEQAALRRVATLVAGDAAPERVFQVVTDEVRRLLGLRSALLLRYEGDGRATVVGTSGEPEDELELGAVFERSNGFRTSVGVPIALAGATWGALVAGLPGAEAPPAETERRLAAFADLVALALGSAHARDELAASRLRIVEAGDAERRRLERNLHDGAQQRLVALSVGLRLAQRKIRSDPTGAEELIEAAAAELGEALVELRELAQGLHPAVLAERGLAAALEVLAARSPLPVQLEVQVPERLPEPVEVAAYYVVSEALANVVKHADARSAVVRVTRADGRATVRVSDDGAGGADPRGGSGLWGLRDRVEALDGTLEVASSPGRGTVVRAELPVR